MRDIERRLKALEESRSGTLYTADKDEVEAFIALFAYGAEHLTWERYDSDNPHLAEAVKRAAYQMSNECHGSIPGLEDLILEPAPWSLAARRVDEEGRHDG
ncbi:hypothetical protein [Halomonas sp. H5]|uniref:hypothetical protein n=1 Tax=Halomonas sp. H5 TaxID=3423910 RepID=UPI003D36B3F6